MVTNSFCDCYFNRVEYPHHLDRPAGVLYMGEPCTVTIYRTETGCVVRLVGRGTMRESPTVRDFVCGTIENGAEIVFDLSSCEYLDSTFLGCLVLLHKRAMSRDGSFSVHADESVRQRLLENVRLLDVLKFIDECPECFDAPVSLHVTNVDRTEFCRHLLETHHELAELGGLASDTFRRIADQLADEIGDIST